MFKTAARAVKAVFASLNKPLECLTTQSDVDLSELKTMNTSPAKAYGTPVSDALRSGLTPN